MKLEAIDKKSTSQTCVASVADVLGDRILVHFDGWEDIYDYWCDLSSPYIHPVGWCQEMGKPLSPPNGKNPLRSQIILTGDVIWHLYRATSDKLAKK